MLDKTRQVGTILHVVVSLHSMVCFFVLSVYDEERRANCVVLPDVRIVSFCAHIMTPTHIIHYNRREYPQASDRGPPFTYQRIHHSSNLLQVRQSRRRIHAAAKWMEVWNEVIEDISWYPGTVPALSSCLSMKA